MAKGGKKPKKKAKVSEIQSVYRFQTGNVGYVVDAGGGLAGSISNSTVDAVIGLTVPDAPSSLTATAISDTEIDLAWTDNSDDETGFRVEQSANGTTGWSEVTTTAADATSYSVTGLTAETTYYYRVIAENAQGDSDPSNVANDTTEATPFSPSDISGLIIWLDAANRGSTSLRWDDLSGNGNHFTAVSASTFPSFAGGEATFDGTDFLNGPNLTALTAGEAFIRAKKDSGGDSRMLIDFGTNGSSNHFPFSDNTIYDDFGNGLRRSMSGAGVTYTNYMTVNWWSAANDWALLIDGVSKGTSGSNTVAFSAQALMGGANGSYLLAGKIKQFLMYNKKLTAGERAQVKAYMDAL